MPPSERCNFSGLPVEERLPGETVRLDLRNRGSYFARALSPSGPIRFERI